MSTNITSLTVRVESSGIKETSTALGGLSTSAANATRRIDNLIEATKRLQTAGANAANIINTQLQQANQSINASANAVRAATTSSNAASQSGRVVSQALLEQRRQMELYNMAGREYAKAQAEAIRMNQQFDRSLQQSNRAQRRHNEGMREAHGLVRGLTGSLGALWVSYGNIAGIAAGLALGASMKAVVTIGKDVEHTLEGIRVRGEESVGSINSMRDAIYDLGKGVYGPREVAKAFDVLILAGISAEQAMVGIKDALNLATVGGTTIEKSAEVLVQVSTALGMTADGYGRISDVIAKTAAVSISSVESISESFKSASVVGKLYGQSLVDLGTQFAILSNLGIKNTLAGTASKNFFSDLASGTDKVTRGLGLLKLTIKDLQDETGRFKSFNEVMRTLAGDSEKGFNSLTLANQKYVQSLITNERGNKLMTEGLDLIRKKGTETATALDDVSKKINESWGFTAQGAAAMALTVESQFKSVKNTLQSSLGEAFTEIQPQLSLVAARLKSAFGSSEFKTGVASLATGVANLTAFLVENAESVWNVVRAFIAFKVASMITGVLVGIAQGFVAVKTAMDLAKISAIGFQAALGLLGIALAASGALLVWWMTKRDEANGNAKQRAALNYMDDFKSKLDEENERLEKQIDLMNKGATATEAYNQAQMRMQLQKVQQQGQDAVSAAEGELKDTWKGIDPRTQKILEDYTKGKRPSLDAQDHYRATQALQAMAKATENLNKVKGDVLTKQNETNASVERNIALSRRAAEMAEADAKKRGQAPEGTGVVPPKTNKAAKNDAYAAGIEYQSSEIEKARKAMTTYEEEQNKLFKAGQIGKLQMIERVGAEQVKQYGLIQKALQDKIDDARGKGDKSELTRYIGDQKQASADLEAAKRTNSAATELAITHYQETNSRLRIAQLEKEGKFGQAAQERFSTEHSATYKQAEADALHYAEVARKALAGGDESGAQAAIDKAKEASDTFKQLGETQKASVEAGFNREAMDRFMVGISEVRNSFKSVQAAYEGQGLGAMWDAATEASANYRTRIEEIKQGMLGMTDPKMIAAANAELTNTAENQRKMWVGVGEAIGNSLESAFGRGGAAMGGLVDVATRYNNLENKTAGARVKAYGDAAAAAKGFFKENTTGYKVMETAEKAFRTFELAMALKSFVVKSGFLMGLLGLKVATDAQAAASEGAYTLAALAGSALRAAAKGIEAVLNQGSGDPYTAFGRMAAMAAVVAGLGIAIGSIGGGDAPMSAEERQRTQGTGSVLGATDAKSESIANSLEHLEKNSGLGLYHSSEMVKSLKAIQGSIGSLASMVVQSTGIDSGMGPDGYDAMAKWSGKLDGAFGLLAKPAAKISNAIFGGKVTNLDGGFTLDRTTVANAMAGGVNASKYVDTKKDGGWFSSDKYRTDTESLGEEANAQFGKIIGSFADVLKDANKELGINSDMFASELAAFNIDIGKISFKDMTGEEIEKELQAVFSKLGDDMAKWAFAGLVPFQKVGEGMLETVARVTNNLIQVKDVFAVLDKQFYLTGVAAVTVSESMIELAGGIESLTENTKFYVDNFLTEAERLAPITKSVNDRLRELNISEVKTVELFKQKIQSLNLMNAADRELYVNMIELAPAFKEAADYAQDLIDGTVDLTDAQEKALDAVNKARSALQDAYDKESSALQGVIDKTKSFISTLASYKDSLKLGGDSPLTNVQKYDEAGSQLASTLEKAMGGDQAAKDKFTSAASAFLSASKVVNASGAAYLSDFAKVQSMIDKLSANAVNEVDMAQASLDALNRQVEGLLEVNKSVLTVAQAIINLQAAITAGSATGLTNNQMGVIEAAPVPGNSYYDREGQKYYPTMIAAIKENTEAVNAQRAEQKAQVGAQVATQVDSAERIIETLEAERNNSTSYNISYA